MQCALGICENRLPLIVSYHSSRVNALVMLMLTVIGKSQYIRETSMNYYLVIVS